MKQKPWLFPAVAALTAMTVLAQDTTPAPPPAPTPPVPAIVSPPSQSPPGSEAPAKPKTPRHRSLSVKKRVVLDPPATATVKGETVNVRGQPNFTGEVLGHLKKGETVTVLEEISLSRAAKGEPAQWSEISIPTNILVWVDGEYVDATAHTVKARRVNLRGGPGENFSVVGRLEKGAPVNEARTKNGWIAIQPPTNAYAFVASELLDVQPATSPIVAPPPSAPPPAAPAPVVVNVPPSTPATPAAGEPAPAPAAPAPVAPAPTPQSEVDQELAALRSASPPEPAPSPVAAPPAPEPTAPRVVTREGFVHKSYNIQAPADYELHDVQTGQLIDYLQPQPDQKFKIYVGTRVTVTGPELLDQRWPRTPVLQVQNVQLMP